MKKLTYKPLIKIYPYDTMNNYFQLNSYLDGQEMVYQKGYFKYGEDIKYHEDYTWGNKGIKYVI
jgi:hypothetical protein